MTIAIANLNLNTSTFDTLAGDVNNLNFYFSNYVVTVAANTAGSITSGNAVVNGSIGANNIYVGTGLSGGVLGTPAALIISSNLVSNGALASFNSNVSITSANAWFAANVHNIVGNTIIISANGLFTNTVLFNAAVTHNAATTFANTVSLSGSLVSGAANVNLTGANVTINGTTFTVDSNVVIAGGLTTTVNLSATYLSVTTNTTLGNTSITGPLAAAAVTASGLAVFNANTTANGGIFTVNANTTFVGNGIFTNTVYLNGSQVSGTANVNLTGANVTINGTTLTIGSNVVFNAPTTFANIAATNLTVSTNTTLANTNITGPLAANAVTAAGLATFNANTTINGALLTINANTNIVGNATFSNAVTFSSNATFGNLLTATGNALFSNVTISNNLLPSGSAQIGTVGNPWNIYSANTNANNVLATNVVSNTVSLNSLFDMYSYANANLGATTGSALTVLTIPTATYRSGEIHVQTVDLNANFEYETLLFVQATGNVYLSTGGSIWSNTQLHTLSANIQGANVNIQITQNSANLGVKMVAQLFRA